MKDEGLKKKFASKESVLLWSLKNKASISFDRLRKQQFIDNMMNHAEKLVEELHTRMQIKKVKKVLESQD